MAGINPVKAGGGGSEPLHSLGGGRLAPLPKNWS